ncbi:MAG: PAS domain S-box protein, partial [Verrucomicrobia bacterium]|nr:PAS domain S-box protein [Verrucomicrobiota bacterium]
ITERKSAEELLHRAHDELEQRVRGRTAELAETNEKLQVTLGQMNELYHQAPCGYYSVDATGRFTKINDTALQLLGYAREELVGKKTIFDIETPASRMAGLEAFKLLKAGQAVRDLQLELVRKDGSVLTVSLNATAVLDDSGRMVRSRSAFVDVSDRVTVQQSLARSEARLQAILDFSPVVMFLKDLQGRYRLVNREFEQAFGLKQEQVLGKTDAELFPPEIAPTFQANDRAVLRTGHARTFEETVPYIGGSHVSVVVKFPLRDSSGQINALGGMAIDITQRKQAEAALRASEARFRSFVESAPDAVVIVDGDGRIQLVNARTEQMFGYRREELLGQSWERLMPARFLRGQLGKKTRHLVTPRARPTGTGLQLFGRRKGGDEFPIEISLSLLETGPGSPVCAAIRDVTVRKRMEDALRESKEHYLALFKQSRAAHREMQRLSRLVLHAQENERKRISRELHDDVGQLLTVTSMMLKGVSQDGPAQPAVDRRKLDEARRLLQTAMEKVHDFALELRPNLLDEAGLLPALRSTLSSVAEQAGLQVRLRADPSVEQLGPEEKLTLFRIAQESLNNIVKHAQASRVHATVARSAGAITLTLTDNGKSFDAKLGHQAGRRRLGLLGMKERARLVNGKFAIQGRPGKGTTVQVKIPFKKSSSSRRRAGNKPTVKNVRPDSAASLQP